MLQSTLQHRRRRHGCLCIIPARLREERRLILPVEVVEQRALQRATRTCLDLYWHVRRELSLVSLHWLFPLWKIPDLTTADSSDDTTPETKGDLSPTVISWKLKAEQRLIRAHLEKTGESYTRSLYSHRQMRCLSWLLCGVRTKQSASILPQKLITLGSPSIRPRSRTPLPTRTYSLGRDKKRETYYQASLPIHSSSSCECELLFPSLSFEHILKAGFLTSLDLKARLVFGVMLRQGDSGLGKLLTNGPSRFKVSCLRGNYGRGNPDRCVCLRTGAISTFANTSSFFWTVAIAIYLYVFIVKSSQRQADNLVLYFHLISWGVPFAITVAALSLHKIGYDASEVSVGWCWVNIQAEDHVLWMLLTGKIWEFIAYVTLPVLYILIKIHINRAHAALSEYRPILTSSPVSHSLSSMADRKLTLIPIIFIILRVWSTIRFLLLLTDSPAGHNPVLVTLHGIGNTFQGAANCIMFVLFTPSIRSRLLALLCCKGWDGPWSSEAVSQNRANAYTPSHREENTSPQTLENSMEELHLQGNFEFNMDHSKNPNEHFSALLKKSTRISRVSCIWTTLLSATKPNASTRLQPLDAFLSYGDPDSLMFLTLPSNTPLFLGFLLSDVGQPWLRPCDLRLAPMSNVQ
ncbi:G-protein coupled receptor [Pimephales promelas]|nr:G-protein coupled receptor [Pimephales promelas]